MSQPETASFSDYANFPEREQSPALPIEKQPDLEKVDMSHGTYTSVFELDDWRN